jgi:hypothetical protein
VQAHEWLLTAAVIVVPLLIAVVVTAWSLEQARYRPKKRRPANSRQAPSPDAERAGSEPSAMVDPGRP